MDRNTFLKTFSLLPVFWSCKELQDPQATTDQNGTSAENCPPTPSETEGPFPIKNPTQFIVEDIRGDRKGLEMLMELTVLDGNSQCVPLPNSWVDVWQCDA